MANRNLVTANHNLVTANHNRVTANHSLVTANHSLVMANHNRFLHRQLLSSKWWATTQRLSWDRQQQLQLLVSLLSLSIGTQSLYCSLVHIHSIALWYTFTSLLSSTHSFYCSLVHIQSITLWYRFSLLLSSAYSLYCSQCYFCKQSWEGSHVTWYWSQFIT